MNEPVNPVATQTSQPVQAPVAQTAPAQTQSAQTAAPAGAIKPGKRNSRKR